MSLLERLIWGNQPRDSETFPETSSLASLASPQGGAAPTPDFGQEAGGSSAPVGAEVARPDPSASRPVPAYAFPWPDTLPSLGRRHVGPFVACERCGTGTWVRYGETPRCLPCALAVARGSA